jgi:hypothetical protein
VVHKYDDLWDECGAARDCGERGIIPDKPSSSKKIITVQELRRPIIDISGNVGSKLLREIVRRETAPQPLVPKARGLTWEKVNEVTYKITDGEQTNVPACHGHWAGYRTTMALAWIISIAPDKWLARCEDQACGPYPFAKAKAAAIAMAAGAWGNYQLDDPIKHLNAFSARYERDAGERLEEAPNGPYSIESHETHAARALTDGAPLGGRSTFPKEGTAAACNSGVGL